eukprot:symbB.v1.2.034639.t1/scaffold4472.1/size40791/3
MRGHHAGWNGGYGGGWNGDSRELCSEAVVTGIREDVLQLSCCSLPWNVLGLAQPPQLWRNGERQKKEASLQWRLHICSAKSAATDWAVGDRNTTQGVLGEVNSLTLRTGIFTLNLTVSPGCPLPVTFATKQPELLHFARPFSICATHRSSDMHVLCRTLCPDAYDAVCHRGRGSVVSATTTAGYAEEWRGLIELEAVVSAVDEGLGRHLTDVWVEWESHECDGEGHGILGHFEVKAALLFAHKMKFRSAMNVGEWASSWLCIRRHLRGPKGRPWHGHGAVIKASFDEKDLVFADDDDTWQDSSSNLRVTFRILPGKLGA